MATRPRPGSAHERRSRAQLGSTGPSRTGSAAHVKRRAALILPFALVAAPLQARGEPDPLRYDARDVAFTAGAAALALALAAPRLAPRRCRLCSPDAFDAEAQERLVWRDPRRARTLSDLLANAVVPGAALAGLALSARSAGRPSAALVDALLVAEGAAVAAGVNGLAKDLVARRRPGPAGAASGAGNRSFYSGHASQTFSIVTAAGAVASRRGYPSAPWTWGAGLFLATGVAYLRVAGDAHWTTDVLAGAAAGGIVGLAVPWLLHGPGDAAPARFRVTPSPGGLAVRF